MIADEWWQRFSNVDECWYGWFVGGDGVTTLGDLASASRRNVAMSDDIYWNKKGKVKHRHRRIKGKGRGEGKFGSRFTVARKAKAKAKANAKKLLNLWLLWRP
eukprot:12908553-Prorocentrum_lima.AAC.1